MKQQTRPKSSWERRAEAAETQCAAAVELLREWCAQERWTTASADDHAAVCLQFVRDYDAARAAAPEAK